MSEVLRFEPNLVWEYFTSEEPGLELAPSDFRFWVKLARPATSENESVYQFAFELSDVAPDSGAGRLRALLYGVSNLPAPVDHAARILINDHEIDRRQWDGLAPITLDGPVDGQFLLPGRNVVTVELVEPQGSEAPIFDVAMLDWVELTYPRMPKAYKDYVRFSADSRPVTPVAIEGFDSGSLTALDVTNARLLKVDPPLAGKAAVIHVDAPTSVVAVYGPDTPLGAPQMLEPKVWLGLRDIKADVDYIMIFFEESPDPRPACPAQRGRQRLDLAAFHTPSRYWAPPAAKAAAIDRSVLALAWWV